MYILTILKQAATLSSGGFILISVVVWYFLAYVWPRHRRLAAMWIAMTATLLLVLSFPFVASALSAPLLGQAPRSDETFDRLIVLDGDNRNGRARQAAREWSTSRPEVVYVLGSDWLLRALEESGVPSERIKSIGPANTTREQIALVSGLTSREPSARFALIASGLQMPRLRALAQAAGARLTMIVSPADDRVETKGFEAIVPSGVALSISRDSLYEHAALAYYRWRGWIDAAPAATNPH